MNRQSQPLPERRGGACHGIGINQPCASCAYLLSDIHRLSNRHREGAAQGFGHHHTEVLLVRGQAEQFGAAEGTPLELTAEHAGPGDALGNAQCGGTLLQCSLPAHLIRAGDHQLQSRIARCHRREGLDQQIHPLLGMDAAQEQEDALTAQLGKALQEGLSLKLCISRRRRRAVANHHLMGPVQPERLAS